jgi:hypothetical protein
MAKRLRSRNEDLADGGAVRDASYPHVLSRNTPWGPEAWVPGTGLAVWEIVKLSRDLPGDADQVAQYLASDTLLIAEGLAYAESHQPEIEQAIDHAGSMDIQYLRTRFPDLRVAASTDVSDQ